MKNCCRKDMSRIRMAIIIPAIIIPALLALVFGSASLASASVKSVSHSAPRVRVKNGTSLNWSGYAVETNLASPQAGAVTDVKGQWTVPAVTGSSDAYSSMWVGIDGYNSGTVEQIGTEEDISSGSPVYYAWFEMYPKFGYEILSVPINAGDKISAEVNYAGSNNFVLSITDLTTGQSFSTTQKSATAQRQSAEWVMEAPSSNSNVLPLADYGTAFFSGSSAMINGHTGGIIDPAWQHDDMTMVSQSNIVESTPSAPSPDGSSFEVMWGDGACAKPQLSPQLTHVFWATLSDYSAGRLSATIAISNASSQPAMSTQITGDTNTNSVTLSTPLPASFGDIAASPLNGDVVAQTLVYNVPIGVTGFRTSFTAAAKDACSAGYTYP